MSSLEVSSIASVVQLAGALYSVSKQLYEVGSALSNAPSDIKDLANDLEIFSEELLLYSLLTNRANSLYTSQIHALTINIISQCAKICVKIDGILMKLRSGNVLARLKWTFKEKEIRRLLERLRDLKLSLMGVLSMLRGLKADYMMDELGVVAPSSLKAPRDEGVEKRMIEKAEETKRKLEGITKHVYTANSLGINTLTGQNTWASGGLRTSENMDGCRIEAERTVRSTAAFSAPVPVASMTRIPELTSVLSISTPPIAVINLIAQNSRAAESVQSFHSAVSQLGNTATTVDLASSTNLTSSGGFTESPPIATNSFGEEQNENVRSTKGERIRVAVRGDRSGDPLHCLIFPSTRLGKVISAYCQVKEVDIDSVRFLHESHFIRTTDTCKSLGIENGDTIYAHFGQVGGGPLPSKPGSFNRKPAHRKKLVKDSWFLVIDSTQLWWRAFKKLHSGERGAIALNSTLVENLSQKITSQEAMTTIIDIISNKTERLQESKNQATLELMERILGIVKAMESAMDYKTGELVWIYLLYIIRHVNPWYLEYLIKRTLVLSQLAEIITLVARYTILENIYHQWPGMCLEKNYECSLINLCVHVLKFLEILAVNVNEIMKGEMLDDLTEIMREIHEADTECREFSVRILEDGLKFTLDEHEFDDEDKEEEEEEEEEDNFAKNLSHGKRSIGDVDGEGDQGGAEARNPGDKKLGATRRVKRMKG